MDIRELTLKIKVDGKELKVLSSDTKRLASEVDNARRKGASSMAQFSKSLDTIQKRLSSIILSTIKWGAVIAGAFAAFSFGLLVREGIRFNQVLETSRIGIAAVVSATQQISTAQGQVLTGAEKFNAALSLSRDIQQQLQVMNLQTAATYEQLLITAQAVIPAAAAQGIELDKSLKLTQALVQATTGIGLEMRQAVSEARSLLEGSINPMTDQLANALNISAKDVKEWQNRGVLADELLKKLENFIRAGELAQFSWAGVTSNLKDAVGIVTGASFEGTFNTFKRLGQELIESMVTFKGETFEVNPALLEIGRIIDEEIVFWLGEAEQAAKDFVNSFSASDVRSNLNEIKEGLADFLDTVDSIVQFTRSDADFAAYGVLGYLLFGPVGAIIGVMAGLRDDFDKFVADMEKATQKSAIEVQKQIEKNNQQIEDLRENINEAKKELEELETKNPLLNAKDFATSSIFDTLGRIFIGKEDLAKEIKETIDQYSQGIKDFEAKNRELVSENSAAIQRMLDNLGLVVDEKLGDIRTLFAQVNDPNIDSATRERISQQLEVELGHLSEILAAREEYAALLDGVLTSEELVSSEQDNQKGFLGEIADRMRDSVVSSQQIEAYTKLIEKYMNSIAPNSFNFAAGLFGALGASAQIADIFDQLSKAGGGKGLQTRPNRSGGGEPDSAAKKAARERERIEEQLRDSINKIVLDREDYERFQIEETVEKARKAGVDKVLIAEFQAAKELEIEREKYKEFQDLLDRRTEEQIKRNEEILDAFNNIRVANLPESLKLSTQLESDLDDIQKALDTQNITFEEAERERLLTTQRYAELIADARKQEYIQSLKSSDSFFDQLKGGFLEFALAVESNGELAAQFFADTLSQMSQSFSDLFFNVLTGRFDDLKDLAKQTFQAILRAFLDMVAAIATRQIIVNIAGSFGIGKGQPGGAAGALGLGKDAVGLAGAGIGLFGGGAAAGGATAAAIGGAAGGVGSVGVSGLTAGIPVSTLAGGGSTGVLGAIGAAAPYIGAVLAAAALAYSILGPLLKKTPRLDIDFDSVKTDMGRRAAVVNEFLDPDFFIDNIGQVSVKRKAGLGLGGDEKILELIQQRIQETVEGIQDIIRRLPSELFNQLNETLLNAEIDIDTVIGGERLLEFDAKGKKIAEKFQAFIEGELPAKFFAAIRESFFDPAFQALGVSAEGTQQLIDDFMAKLEAAGSREERAIIGQEFIDTFSAFVDAFNIVSGNANDAIGQTMNTIKGLANQLGFEAVPSIEQLRMKLGELLENAELDPETVQMYADLRNAIVALTVEVVNSISGLIGKMQSLNQTLASLGQATVDMSGYLSQAASQIQSFLQNNQGELSLSEQEAFLDQLTGIANAMLQEEMAAFNAEQERLRAEAQAAYEAQRAQIQGRIDGLNREKEAINETFRARIDALNEELKLAQDFAAATESIRNTLDGIIFSQQSIFTSVERVNMLQGNIADLQNQLANTDDPNRQLDLIGSLEDAFKTLFDTAGEAFGVNSPEFVSIFDQVTGGLSDLANMTENRGRSAEEIQAEIERLTAENGAQLAAIDASIQAAQAQLSSLQQQTVDNTFVASQELQDLFAYIQSEYQRLLDERFAQLGEISEFGFQNEVQGLEAVAGLTEASLVTLKEQLSQMEIQTDALHLLADHFTNAPGFAGGSGGLKDFGDRSLAFLHGQEAVLTKAQYLSIMGSMEAAISLQRNFGNVLQSFTGAMSGMGLLNKFANEIQGGTNLSNLTQKLTKGGYISSLAGELPRTPEQVVRERTAELAKENEGPFRIELTINSNNPGVVQVAAEKVAEEVEKRLVKRLDPAAKTMREAVQNRARKANR